MVFHFKHNVFILFFLSLCFTATAQRNFTLQQALQTARANNPVLKTEQFNIGVAQTDVTTAKLFINPTFNFNYMNVAAKSYAEPNSNLYSAINNQYAFQFGKSFQVAGQRRYSIETANKNVAFLEKNYTETERNLFSEVAAKWLEVWTAQKQLDILTTAKNNIDSLVISEQIRYKNQVITQTDLLRTELLSKQYTIQYKTAFQELINQQKELQFLLGVKDSISIDTEDHFLFSIPHDIDSLLTQSLQNRSDILTAKSFIDFSNSNIKLQKSLAFPQPELGFFTIRKMPFLIGVFMLLLICLFSTAIRAK